MSLFNSELVIERLASLGLVEITIDLDGTVISTKGNPSWAFKGYNPIKRGAKSYFPLTAHIAETGHFLHITNRPGNVHDSNRALQVIKTVQRKMPQFSLRFRADSAFCVPQVLNHLLYKDIPFAIKAPFWKLLSLKQAAQKRKRWFRINDTWSYFWVDDPIESLQYAHHGLVLRKKLREPRKPFQLELFTPNNGVYEYSAVLSHSKEWDPEDLLLFVAGRSAQENSIGDLKSGFAFDSIPTRTYQANSAYMQISQMAYNLSISMQQDMGLSTKQARSRKKTRMYRIMEWRTFRFLILNKAGRIAWEDGKKVLKMTYNKASKKLYDQIHDSLQHKNYKLAA